jgi:hypothetical protein
MYASNKLYNGDIGSRIEALNLRRQALLHEASFPYHKDETNKSLLLEVKTVERMIKEWDEVIVKAEEELLNKWIDSNDPVISDIAERLLDEDWQSLAI